MQPARYYEYTLSEQPTKGIHIIEDIDGWLYVHNDPESRRYFSILDIEKDLEITLILRNAQTHIAHTIN